MDGSKIENQWDVVIADLCRVQHRLVQSRDKVFLIGMISPEDRKKFRELALEFAQLALTLQGVRENVMGLARSFGELGHE